MNTEGFLYMLMYDIHYMCSAQCSVNHVHYTLYIVHCILYNVQH